MLFSWLALPPFFPRWFCSSKLFPLSRKSHLLLATTSVARNAYGTTLECKFTKIWSHFFSSRYHSRRRPIGLLGNWKIRIQPSRCPKQISFNSALGLSRKAVMAAMTRRTDPPLLLLVLRILPTLLLVLLMTEMKRPIADASESQPHRWSKAVGRWNWQRSLLRRCHQTIIIKSVILWRLQLLIVAPDFNSDNSSWLRLRQVLFSPTTAQQGIDSSVNESNRTSPAFRIAYRWQQDGCEVLVRGARTAASKNN